MTVPAATAQAAGGGAKAAVLAASQSQESTAFFKTFWTVYHKLLEVDFLEHTPLYAALKQLLLKRYGGSSSTGSASSPGQPISMLDLGCGDAMQIARTLRECGCPGGDQAQQAEQAGGLRLASYTGVDVTPPALELAAGYLSFLRGGGVEVELVEQDMKQYTQACSRQYDLVFASFAVHHLSLEGKREFVGQVARCLKPGGLFVLVDVFMREEEDREQYMQRYRRNIADAVQQGVIEEAEWQLVLEHVTNFDFPERLSTYQAMAAAAGFSSVSCAFTDSKEFGRLVVMTR